MLAIRAYLATVAPVSNAGDRRTSCRSRSTSACRWYSGTALNFTPGRYQPNPQKSAEWNRGAYIVEGAAHCGTCHTPKTLLGGDKTELRSPGATLQGWFAPNITTDPRKGIGGWSKDDLVQYLKTGTNNWTLASGPMAEAVLALDIADDGRGYLRHRDLSEGQRRRCRRAQAGPGCRSTTTRCAPALRSTRIAAPPVTGIPAHGEVHLFPRLAGSALVQSDDPTTLVRVVLQGTRAVSTPSQADRAGDAGFRLAAQ